MRSLSLRPILVIPFVLEILAVVGLTGYISHQNGQKAVNLLSYQLREEVTDRVQEHLNYYFEEADKITRDTTDAIESGLLKKDDFPAIGRFFWNQFRNQKVSFINYGLKTGEYAGAGSYNADGSDPVISETSARTGFKNYNYPVDKKGNRIGRPEVVDYEFRNEPWFYNTVRYDRPLWTEPYTWDDADVMSIAIGRPVLDRSGKVIGAMSVDLSLAKISTFLRQIKISPSGKIIVLDNRGKLFATSNAETPFRIVEGGVEQVKTGDSPDRVIKNAGDYLTGKFKNFANIKEKYHGEFFIDNQRYFVHITPWHDNLNLNLFIMVIVPEKDFMGAIQKNTQLTIIVCILALFIAVIISFMTAKYIINPIIETVSAADLLSKGEWNKYLPKTWIKELDSLRNSFNTMSLKLERSFNTLEHTAYHDALTQLPNQLFFRKNLEEKIQEYRRDNKLFAVLFLDLDFFKLVNDSLGHLAGDILLIQVADRLKKCVRENDTVARFGGDEFVILLDNIHSQQQAVDVAGRICKELQKSFKIKDNAVFINTSIGIVFSDLYPMSVEEILKNADIALYRSKSNGKGKYTIFNHQMSLDSQKRLSLETDLRLALEKREIEVYYQPILNITDRRIVGFEALMRWRHSKLGLISPEIFIPIAEETGSIGVLGWWTARQACFQLKRWQEKYPECADMTMNVNFSGKQFFEPDFLTHIEKILAETGIKPKNLAVEVTESIFIKYTDVMKEKLLKLNSLGVGIALDDFGIGYSCLSYLKDFTIDTLKIDRSFIRDLLGNPQTLAILESIAILARKLDIELIAEGIETREQLDIVNYIGCYRGQGYLFSRPLKALQCQKFIEKSLVGSPEERLVSFPSLFDRGAS